MVRTLKNVPMVFVYLKEMTKRLIGDKFNPAYMSEVKGTTGKVVRTTKEFRAPAARFAVW
jgi:hypothetical protein